MARRVLLATTALAAALLFTTTASAQDGGGYPTDNDVNRVAKLLYCPVCPNTPLDVCETRACQDWRAQIRDQLAAGWTEEQVVDYFVAQYGERVLAEPQRRGFTSLVWILPVIAVGLGLAAIGQVVRTWRRASVDNAPETIEALPQPPALSPEVLARIERELKDLA